jgi:hypothetical protein
MDAAALQLALAPSSAPVEARLLLRMGYLTLRDIAAVESIPTRQDPWPDDDIALPYEEFESAVATLVAVDTTVKRTAVEAWPQFSARRAGRRTSAIR